MSEAAEPAAEPDPGRMNEVTEHLFAGRKIQAIKVYREWKGTGLAEAKTEVEAIEARLRSEIPERFTASPGKGCAGVLLLGAVGSVVWYFAR